jgi:hypothetical protein
MAAGDLTRDTGSPMAVGNMWLLTGTMEVDTTLRAFALGGTKVYVHSVTFAGEDDALACKCGLNQNASAVATNGTVAVQSNLNQVNTVRYEALITM